MEGFHVAAGIIDLNNPYVEDPQIGKLKMFIKSWDYDDPLTNGKV